MSGNGTMKNFKAMLGDSKRPERSVEICMRGDLVADFEQAERELKVAISKATDSLAGASTGDIAARLEALTAQMQDHTYPFRLRSMPRHEFRAMVAAHPPRRDPDSNEVDERDRYVGINSDTFYEALIRACVIDPELDEDDWRRLLGEALTDSQFDALADAAWRLNRGEIDVPFSRAASLVKRDTASA